MPLECLVEEFSHTVRIKWNWSKKLNLAVLNISSPCEKKYIYSEHNLYSHYGLVHQMVFSCLVQLKSQVCFTSYFTEISVSSKHVMVYEIMCFC